MNSFFSPKIILPLTNVHRYIVNTKLADSIPGKMYVPHRVHFEIQNGIIRAEKCQGIIPCNYKLYVITFIYIPKTMYM